MFAVTGGGGFASQGTAWDLSAARYAGISFDFSSQLASPRGLSLKDDGTKLFLLDAANATTYQYTLSTAWNVSTASYDSVSFGSSAEDTSPTGLFFKPDGTKLYITGTATDRIYQYSLSTAWASSTASYDNISIASSTETSSPNGLFFKPDGTKVFIVGSDTIFQYTLSTAWASSTASYDSVSLGVSGQDISASGMFIKDDGTKIFVIGDDSNSIYQYRLSIPWASSTAVHDGISFSVGSQDISPADIFFN